MDGRTERQRPCAERAAAMREQADREMKAKGKIGAVAGKQKRPARAANKPKSAVKPKSSISLGEQSVRPSFLAGQNATALRDEDWNFRPLVNEDRATLVAACWYEYARESQHVRQTAERWLQLQSAVDDLWPDMQEIAKSWAEKEQTIRCKPKPIKVTAKNWRGIAKAELSVRAFYGDKRLPREPRECYRDLAASEQEMQTIEARGGVGAPRLRTLAKHLVADSPWLLLPARDREHAIQSAFKDRIEVPSSAAGSKHLRVTRAFERVRDRTLKQLKVVFDEESAIPGCRAGTEILPVVIRWGEFSDGEIKKEFAAFVDDARPPQWKNLVQRKSSAREDWWIARLKELAAMRLRHAFTADKARQKFRTVWRAGGREILNDETNFPKLATAARKRFVYFFPFEEKPRRGDTWMQRGGPC